MARTFNESHQPRGSNYGEFSSKRLPGWPPAGRYTKTLTHRIERRQAEREIRQALEEAQDTQH